MKTPIIILACALAYFAAGYVWVAPWLAGLSP